MRGKCETGLEKRSMLLANIHISNTEMMMKTTNIIHNESCAVRLKQAVNLLAVCWLEVLLYKCFNYS